MRSLTLIGAGRAGRTLGRLWREHGVFAIGGVVTRSEASARAAAEFIGAGRPLPDLAALGPAEVVMIATPDDRIAECAAALAASGVLRRSSIVFHLSGAQPSSILAPCAECGAAIAGVHPIKSFAEPEAAVQSFAGTWCGLEGDAAALALLREAFEALGARTFTVDPAGKLLYHAALVLVCNDLTALMEAGVRCLGESGVDRGQAMALIEPLVRETVDHVFSYGTARALTGPVARGDDQVIRRHLEALSDRNADTAELYRHLGRIAVDLARARGRLAETDLARLEAALRIAPGAEER